MFPRISRLFKASASDDATSHGRIIDIDLGAGLLNDATDGCRHHLPIQIADLSGTES